MKKLILKIYIFFYTLRLRWRGNMYNYKRAVRKACQGKKRSYVYFIGGKYRVFTREDIKMHKRAGVFRQGINTQKLAKICLFDTIDGIPRHPNPKYNQFKP